MARVTLAASFVRPGKHLIRWSAPPIAVTIETGTGTVTFRVLARQIIGVGSAAPRSPIGPAIAAESDVQSPVAGAGGVAIGAGIVAMIRVAL